MDANISEIRQIEIAILTHKREIEQLEARKYRLLEIGGGTRKPPRKTLSKEQTEAFFDRILEKNA